MTATSDEFHEKISPDVRSCEEIPVGACASPEEEIIADTKPRAEQEYYYFYQGIYCRWHFR